MTSEENVGGERDAPEGPSPGFVVMERKARAGMKHGEKILGLS